MKENSKNLEYIQTMYNQTIEKHKIEIAAKKKKEEEEFAAAVQEAMPRRASMRISMTAAKTGAKISVTPKMTG